MSFDNTQISEHDKEVLDRLFNPNLPYGDIVEDNKDTSPTEEEVETEEIKQVKILEADGVKAAETGDLHKSLDLFSKAINVLPRRASGYNNRAQALRLKGDVEGAIDDLNKAIDLSNGRGQVACQAYTQRGLIYKLEAIDLSNGHGQVACQAFTQRGLIYKLEGMDEESLEDFKHAASLGGQFAKQQVVAMNPYAAMCNQMLSEVFHKIKCGEM
ncbi:Tetratricopeptide repeat protein 36 homolog,Tetratricopeptide repeat protein 36 [Mytilus edulis]|uniref:Tetratricopeptide repeat protein 36 homolog,Tetratricopeptide repeat protein 36 n=1 Tax=Mytilus edulis TaxID=6550 RepID=A0A8S3PVA3_MYTED|nr:Tetratricopeptide repeat protein 36 homolog,Tetratricopeptide repeat protein 36 [Mytilus edulis]